MDEDDTAQYVLPPWPEAQRDRRQQYLDELSWIAPVQETADPGSAGPRRPGLT